MNQTYMIVIVDYPTQILRDIITENVRIDFVTVGHLVRGRHWRGQRINVVVNRSRYDFENTTDEKLAEWWTHVKAGLTYNAEIRYEAKEESNDTRK
jgi:hypothetical protein